MKEIKRTDINEEDMFNISPETFKNKPTAIVIIGMAGSGKTTLAKALWNHLTTSQISITGVTEEVEEEEEEEENVPDSVCSEATQSNKPSEEFFEQFGFEESLKNRTGSLKNSEPLKNQSSNKQSLNKSTIESKQIKKEDKKKTFTSVVRKPYRTYNINLDPAVKHVPFPANIDIRDSINIKDVMKHYNLGPNGAIMTALNLFATKIDQLHTLLEKRADAIDYIMLDTPGQIEVFNWSASGSIILDSLAISYPTILLYIVDTVRCQNPITFMSNMLYACGVLYKAKLPFLMVFNKIDAHSPEQCLTWLKDYDVYAEDVLKNDSYMASLSRSCALVINEFYSNIKTVGVSAASGLGFDELEYNLKLLKDEFIELYVPWLQTQRDYFKKKRTTSAQETEQRFTKDLLDN